MDREGQKDNKEKKGKKKMKITHRNIKKRKRKFEYLICMAYYFGDPTDITTHDYDLARKKKIMLSTLKCLANDPAMKNSLVVVYDDASPNKLSELEIFEQVTDRPAVYIQMEENTGCAEKENIFNHISVKFAKYMVRMDDDVILNKSIKYTLDVMKKIKNCGVITINCGILAYHSFWQNEKEYVDSKMIGNIWISPSKVFEDISYNDPTLGIFHDRDISYKMLYKGLRLLVARKPVGYHTRSGANTTTELRRQKALEFAAKNPLVSITLNSRKNPICEYIPKKENFFQTGFKKIGPCERAIEIVAELEKLIFEEKK